MATCTWGQWCIGYEIWADGGVPGRFCYAQINCVPNSLGAWLIAYY